MANFALIANYLEGNLATQLATARQTQGVWEWYNALFRIMSANRVTGTPTVFGPKQLSAGTNVVETVAATVFGILIDNSQAAEDCQVQLSNVAATPGTTDIFGSYYGLRGTMRGYVFSDGLPFSSRLEVFSTLGTNAGLEAGTASTTQPTITLVYTK